MSIRTTRQVPIRPEGITMVETITLNNNETRLTVPTHILALPIRQGHEICFEIRSDVPEEMAMTTTITTMLNITEETKMAIIETKETIIHRHNRE